jgi:hypothetical protein
VSTGYLHKPPYHLISPRILGGGYIWYVRLWRTFFELIEGNQNQDYHGFASDKPEELAQAIQKGIPATLRGMMWQHM